MSSNKVENPYPIFTDTDGKPLENGYIYIGSPGLDAEFNQVSIYLDPELTTPVSQPTRTSGGYPVVNGAVFRFYADGDYSIKVKNKNSELVYSSNNFNSLSGSVLTNFATLADAKAATYLIDGDVVEIQERVSGLGGYSTWDVVLTSSVTPNTFNVVVCTGRPSLSLVLRISKGSVDITQLADTADITTALQHVIDNTEIREVVIPTVEYNSPHTLSAQVNFNRGNIRIVGNTSVQTWTLPQTTPEQPDDAGSIIHVVHTGDAFKMTNIDAGVTNTTSGITFENITFRGNSSSSRTASCFYFDVGGAAKFSRGFHFDYCSAYWFALVYEFANSTHLAGNTTQSQVGDIQITKCSFNFNDKVIDNTSPSVQINKFRMDHNDISNNTTIGSLTVYSGTVTGNIMEGHADTLEFVNSVNFTANSNHFEANTGDYVIKTTGDCQDGKIGPNYFGAVTAVRHVLIEGGSNIDCLDKYIPEQMYQSTTVNGPKYDGTSSGTASYGAMCNIALPDVISLNANVARQASTNHARVSGATTVQTDTNLANERVLLKPYTTSGSGSFSITKTFAVTSGNYVCTTFLMRRDNSSANDPYVQFYINGSSSSSVGSWESPLNNFTKRVLADDDTEEIIITLFARALTTMTSLTINVFPYGISPPAGLVTRYSSLELHHITDANYIRHSLNLEVLNTVDTAPTSGTYIVGDTLINRNPSAGGADRWRCTTAPTTFKALTLDP